MEMLSSVTQAPVQAPAPAAAPAAKPTGEAPGNPEAGRPSRDEYIPEEPRLPTGMYRMGRDKEGQPRVLVDAPEKEEKCTCNTDQVDAEIKALKRKKAELEKELSDDKDNPEKQEQIQRQLDQVTQELRRKDNDAYRRQHSTFTEESV